MGAFLWVGVRRARQANVGRRRLTLRSATTGPAANGGATVGRGCRIDLPPGRYHR